MITTSEENEYRKRLEKKKKSELIDICVNQSRAIDNTQRQILDLLKEKDEEKRNG